MSFVLCSWEFLPEILLEGMLILAEPWDSAFAWPSSKEFKKSPQGGTWCAQYHAGPHLLP